MTNHLAQDITSLVREDCVHKRVYTDPAIFDLEMARIWGNAWIYVGHESQVRNHGDYFATQVARKPVIMIRHSDGEVYVLFNRCAHKGAQVVADVSGNAKVIRCGYHGWTYHSDGTLRTVCGSEDAYDGTRFGRKSPYSNLQKLPRVASYRGFVFASLATEGPDLMTWLGPIASSFDNMIDRSPEGELEVTGGVLRYMHDSNWKFFVENLNDMLHALNTHQSSSQTAKMVVKSMLKENEPLPAAIEILSPFTGEIEFFEKMGVHAFDYGHSYSGGKVSIHSAYSEMPDYTRAMEAAYGRARTQEIFSMNRHNTVVYPSFTLKGAIQTVRVVKPIAVDKTLIESWTFRLVGAPEQMLQRSILYCNLINSSANLVGPDDYEAYHRQQNGLPSHASEWVSMHRYLGKEEADPDGGLAANGSSDMVFRGQFKAWKAYMTQAGE